MNMLTRVAPFASLREALAGITIPESIRNSLTLLDVPYVSFDEQHYVGQLVVHTGLADELLEIFSLMYGMRFPIKQIVPVQAFNWDDDASMAANNSSAFNYRPIAGTDRLSHHSYGWALDLNPMQNPCITKSGTYPPDATYDPSVPGTLVRESGVVRLFLDRGWTWGADWDTPIDYQHFEKPLFET